MSRKIALSIFVLLGLAGVGLLFYNLKSTPAPVLRLGINPWPGYLPFIWARDLKYFNDNEIRVVEGCCNTQTMRGLRNRVLEAGALTLDEVILLASQGTELKIVAVLDISNGADAIVGQPDVTSMTQLKGCKVGYENTALGAYVIYRALELSGMKEDDIQLIPMDIGIQEYEFDRKTVSAIVTFEPVRTKLLRKGGHVLFDSTKIPNEIIDVLAVRASCFDQYAEQAALIMDSWFKASADIQNNPDSTMPVLAQRMDISPEDAKQAFAGMKLMNKKESERLLRGNNNSFESGLAKRIHDIMLKKKLIDKPVQLEKLFVYTNNL